MVEGHSTEEIGHGMTLVFNDLNGAALYRAGSILAMFNNGELNDLRNALNKRIGTRKSFFDEVHARPFGGD